MVQVSFITAQMRRFSGNLCKNCGGFFFPVYGGKEQAELIPAFKKRKTACHHPEFLFSHLIISGACKRYCIKHMRPGAVEFGQVIDLFGDWYYFSISFLLVISRD